MGSDHAPRTLPSGQGPDRVRWLYRVLAVGFALSSAYHAAAIAFPSIAEPSPAWRHGLFVAVNAAMAAGFVRRPWFFPYVFALLAVQQVYSHGTYGWQVWTQEHRVDWASVLVLAAVPAIACQLLRDRARRRGMLSKG